MGEQEPKPPKDIVRLYQEFPLFPAHRVWKSSARGVYVPEIDRVIEPSLQSEITLALDILPDIVFGIELRPNGEVHFTEGFTLTDRRHGYLVSSDDYDALKRKAKIDLLGQKYPNRKINDLVEHGNIVLAAYNDEYHSRGLTTDEVNFEANTDFPFYPFTSQAQGILRRLRFVVKAPAGTFVSEPYSETFEEGGTHFEDFYPAETGPFASDSHVEGIIESGLLAFLPVDVGKHRDVRGKFVLASELKRPRGRRVLRIVRGGSLAQKDLGPIGESE